MKKLPHEHLPKNDIPVHLHLMAAAMIRLGTKTSRKTTKPKPNKPMSK
ncbi:MAG: hypothetical protein OXC92_05320 [Flavobacteriaceae bacterium]|nr:hypothetical protein [Flavobacteriaceae bacterium]